MFRNVLVKGFAPLGFGVLVLLVPVLAHADADYGNGCVLFSDNTSATVDSLRLRCGPAQQDAIYRDAPRGNVPIGAKDGWVASPREMQSWTPLVWIGKDFYTGPGGGYLLNRLTAAGIEAWPANVFPGSSVVDGRPAWVLDYAPSPTPQLYDEIREVTPGVWFGYSWMRQGGGFVQQLSFILS
ncbi:hypothetical protein KP696_02280 [Nocardia seriolae]|nr:hypothetical protein [Nocardia seriolae]MTJ89606.1 hypothetical protein [Nocardia seriolae]MTK33580.1 hypothetical protein [Nocardia seriolae]MTK42725.1 hypothetical protein [Nocardia seriolae]MTK50173.1 hypothetical protein [Nocardia seriolae]